MEKKLYFLSADIEGCCGVTDWNETDKNHPDYKDAQIQMSKEVAAACQAILDAGCDVIVRDGHWTARNVIHEMLPRGVRLMRGWASHVGGMMAGVDEKYAGALYVGYHSPGGSNTNPLAHTISDSRISRIKINGKLASEFTMNSMYAAYYGVPSIFISGDKGICDLAEEEVPGIVTAPVKECKGGSTLNLHPLDALDAIYEGVKKALAMEHEVPVLPKELVLEVSTIHHQAVRNGLSLPGTELVDANTIRYVAKDPKELNFVRMYVTQ